MKNRIFVFALSLFLLMACGQADGGSSTSSGGGNTGGDPVVIDNKVTVKFDANGGVFSDGSTIYTVKVEKNLTVPEPSSPIRTNYYFNGWATVEGYIWDFATIVTDDTTLYAMWTAVEYEVTFHLNYDNKVETKVTENRKITYIPTRDNYDFNGWWYFDGYVSGTPILNRKFDMDSEVTGEGLVLYAEWVEKKNYSNQLSVPSLTLYKNYIEWNAVEHAESYQVVLIGDSYEEDGDPNKEWLNVTITETSFDFENCGKYIYPGVYTLKVRAVGDGYTYRSSAWVNKNYGYKTVKDLSGFRYDEAKQIIYFKISDEFDNYDLNRYFRGIYAELLKNKEWVDYSSNVTRLEENGLEFGVNVKNLDAGQQRIRLNAKYDDFYCSPKAYTFDKSQLLKPSSIHYALDEASGNIIVSWGNAVKADSFDIHINNEYIERVSGNQYTIPYNSNHFASGKMVFGVASFDSNRNYTASDILEIEIPKFSKVTVIKEFPDGTSKTESYYLLNSGTISITNTDVDYSKYELSGLTINDEDSTYVLPFDYTCDGEDVTIVVTFSYNLAYILNELFYSRGTIITGVKDTSMEVISVPKGVTSIANGAFGSCKSLRELTLPFSCVIYTLFGTSASSIPSSLKKITLTKDCTSVIDSAFESCSGVEVINIPDTITSIGRYAFKDTIITELNINDGITKIGNYAFGNSALPSFKFPSSIYSIGDSVFRNSLIGSVDFSNTTISYISSSAFSECRLLETVIMSDKIERIYSSAFYNCVNLENISLECVTSIGSQAFFGCEKLKDTSSSYHLEGGIIYNSDYTEIVSTYLNLSSYSIRDTVTTIGTSAFYNCSNLVNFEIPASVTAIETYAFRGTSIESIVLPATLKNVEESFLPVTIKQIYWNATSLSGSLGSYGDLTDVVFASNVTSIPKKAFYKCSSLKNVVLPSTEYTIGESAFELCTSLESISLCNTTTIETKAFYSSGLKSISLSGSIETVKKNAFGNCKSLKSLYYDVPALSTFKDVFDETGSPAIDTVTIGDNVTFIPSYFLYYFKNITSLTIPECVTSIGSYAFSRSSIESIYISDSVSTIGESAFKYCSNLKTVRLSNNLKRIESNLFYDCTSLEEITIPDSVKTISEYAFYHCTSLKTITLGHNTTSYGRYAFYGCDEIEGNIYNGCKYIGSEENPYLVCIGPASDNLESVTFHPDCYALYLNESPFTQCENLKRIDLGNIHTVVGSLGSGLNLESVVIPESLSYMVFDGYHGFLLDSSIENVYFNASSFSVSHYTNSSQEAIFKNCAITNMIVADGVTNFTSDVASLTSVTNLYWNCNTCSYTYGLRSFVSNSVTIENVIFGEGVTKIMDNFLSGHQSLKTVRFSSTIVEVGYNAFAESSLEEVYINSGCQTFGSTCFANITSDLVIHYEGTVDDWNNLNLGRKVSASSVRVICTDGEI